MEKQVTSSKAQVAKPEKIFDMQERTAVFSENIISFCQKAKQDTITRPLISQLIRSATSIGANYTEANAASSRKDFRNKVFISKKEAQETRYWLRLLRSASDANSSEIDNLADECQQLIQILQTIGSKVSEKKSHAS
ncbi:MAG: four helix bundle protein [Patescibacteria group bacterium]